MAGKLKTKQKQVRLTESEARFLQSESFKRDRSESYIIREALSMRYPDAFHVKNREKGVVDGTKSKRARIA